MFGNRLGWGISAALAGLILLLVYYIGVINRISEPSKGMVAKTGSVSLNLETHPQILDEIVLPFNPRAVMPTMTEDKDAGPLYRDAIQAYNKDPAVYNNLFDKRTGDPRTSNLKDLPAIEMLVKARTYRSMNLFRSQPEQVVNHQITPPPISSLQAVGKTASDLSLKLSADPQNAQQAMALAEAVFSLGVKLCEERLRWREFDAGQGLLRDGAYLIAKLDPARTEAAAVDQGMKQLMKDRGMPLATVLSSADQNVIGRSAGDIFYIAKNSKERMWRIEAILKLGWYKFNVGEPGHGPNQRWALIVAKKLADDPNEDPAIKAAAVSSRDFTSEEYNTMTTSGSF